MSMKSENPINLADIVRFLLGAQILGLRTGIPLEDTAGGGRAVTQFEDQVWFLDASGNTLSAIPADLLAALSNENNPAGLFMDAFPPSGGHAPRRLTVRTNGGVYQDSAALIHHALERLPPRTTVAFLVPGSVVIAPSFEQLRADIDSTHAVTWLIFADGRLLTGVSPRLQVVLMLVIVGAGPAEVTRIVNLRNCEPGTWGKEIRAARKREGGEADNTVVLRGVRLGQGPWTYERWTKAYSKLRDDAAELGQLRPLRELVDAAITNPVSPREGQDFRLVGDEEEAPSGYIAVVGGREIRPEGIVLPGRYWARKDAVPELMMVAEGDVLLRTFLNAGPHQQQILAVVVPPGLVAALGPYVILLRWKPEVPRQARELLVSWLTSERASKSLAGNGGACLPQLSTSILLNSEVPHPNDRVVTALESLGTLEEWYQERAQAVGAARRAVFSAERYTEAVPLLLDAQQKEGERVTAAEDSQKFGYLVRNYFPHPVALRREKLLVQEHGKARLEETLECAEHLCHFLAACGLVQLAALQPDVDPVKHLGPKHDGTVLEFNWGNSWSLFKKAVITSRRLKDPLVAPIPGMCYFDDFEGKPNAGTIGAEGALRKLRNDLSHLHGLTEPQCVQESRKRSEDLDELLEAVSFLVDVPLVYIRDYALDGFTGERRVVYDLLRGASVVFERVQRVVGKEIPRESLGLLGHSGDFYTLSPWLNLHTCEVCKRPEVFVFNRCTKGQEATFVAMESGHPWPSEEMGGVFSKLMMPHAGL